MSYQLIEGDPDPSAVRQLTFVPFRPDERCVVRPGPDLPAGTVRAGEYYLLDSCFRIPGQTVGFRPQRVHPFAIDGGHVYVWLDGDHDAGDQPDALVATGADLERRLEAASAVVLRDALRSFRTQSDASYYADNVRLLGPAYLRGTTPQAGSGSGGDAGRWRDTLVEPGGRLLVSRYQDSDSTGPPAGTLLRELGFEVTGSSRSSGAGRGATTAGIDAADAEPHCRVRRPRRRCSAPAGSGGSGRRCRGPGPDAGRRWP